MSYDYEAEYIRAALELQGIELDQAMGELRADHAAGLAQLRESWSSGVATSGGASLDEVQRSIEAKRAEIRDFLHNYADEPDPSAPSTAQREPSGTPTGNPSVPPVTGTPAGLPNAMDRQAELAEAERIKGLSMAAFAAERQRLGVDRNAAHGLFG